VANADAPPGEAFKVKRFLGQACALDNAGRGHCWASPTGLLTDRDGDCVPRHVPELDGALSFVKSPSFSYLLGPDGRVAVWGTQPHSYLGDVRRPTAVPGLVRVVELSSFGHAIAARQQDGTLLHWDDSFVSDEPGEPGVVVSSKPERIATGVRSLGHQHYVGEDAGMYAGTYPPFTRVADIVNPRIVADCGAYTCAVMGPAVAKCWGGRHRTRFELQAPADYVSLQCAAAVNMFALLSDGSVMVETEFGAPHRWRKIATLDGVAELALCRGTLGCPHCVKWRDGTVGCWGEGTERRLGSGSWPLAPQFVRLELGRDLTTPRLSHAP
jgi:hypothetical protein